MDGLLHLYETRISKVNFITMNWTYFDEKTPDGGQMIIAANLKGARQFWLWEASHDLETMKVLGMDFWCPVPDLPKPPDPFEDYWRRVSASGVSLYDDRDKHNARCAFEAGRKSKT